MEDGKGWLCEEMMVSIARVKGLRTRKDTSSSVIEKTRCRRIQEEKHL